MLGPIFHQAYDGKYYELSILASISITVDQIYRAVIQPAIELIPINVCHKTYGDQKQIILAVKLQKELDIANARIKGLEIGVEQARKKGFAKAERKHARAIEYYRIMHSPGHD